MSVLSTIRNGFKRFTNSTLRDPAQWLIDWVRGGEPSASGEPVNEATALGLAVYIACIKNISEDIAKLPLGIYETLEPRGSKIRRELPLHNLLHWQPNPEMSAMSFRQTLTAHALGWHGGFAEIVRTAGGDVLELWPLDPTAVERKRTEGTNRLFYMVHGVPIEADRIFDIHGLGYDGVSAYVMATLAKNPIGNALAAQKFAGSFFGRGTVTSGVLEVPAALSETAFKHLRESFLERQSGAGNMHRPLILEEGTKWTTQTTSAKESQMIETLHLGIEEVCRLFRMPPHKVQHLLRSTFSNIEMQALEYVQDTLLAWIVRWEQEIWRKLIPKRDRKKLFAKHNVNMLLRGDMASRAAFYREQFNVGAMSPNDIRELEDQNPIAGGDAYFLNGAIVPLEMAAKGEHLQKNEPPEPQTDQPDDDAEPSDDGPVENRAERIRAIARAHETAIAEVLSGILRTEHDKVHAASRKEGFGEWLDQFYQTDNRQHFARRLEPAFTAFLASIDPNTDVSGLSELLELLAGRHSEMSLSDLRENGTCDHWRDGSRARRQAALIVAKVLAVATQHNEDANA